MIENMEQLLDVMESAALRQAAHIERTAHDSVARPLDMRQCIFAALVAAQAEGAEMVPSEATNKMIEELYGPFLSSIAHESRIKGYLDALTANPLRAPSIQAAVKQAREAE